MKRIKLVPVVAFLAAISYSSSFAGTPKGDSKSETPTETKAKSGDTYYWFNTNAAGTALLDPSGIPLSQGQSEAGPCNALTGDFCARGYTAAQTTISGGKRVITVAVTASATEARVEE